MTVKNLFLILTLPAMLIGCASPPSATPVAQVAAADQSKPQAKPVAPTTTTSTRRVRTRIKPTATTEVLPPGELTAEVMVKFLAAEIANQRGNWQAAYVSMLSIAQQTRDPRIARRAAEFALNARQPNEALAAVRLWRELSPNSDEANQFFLGLVMLGSNIAEARPLLEQRLKEARPALLGSTMLQIQRLASRSRSKAAAFNLLEDLFAPYDKVPEAHIALAQQAAAMGDDTRAVQEARRAMALDPSSELGILTLAQTLAEKEQSLQVITDFLRVNPNAREVRLAYARMLVEQKQLDKARAQFRILLKSQPEDLTTLYALGLLSAQNDDLKQAEGYLTTYLKLLETKADEERDPTQALLILAQIAEQRDDIPAALKWLDQVEPASQQAYISTQVKRAQLLARSNNLLQARTVLHEARAEAEDDRVQLIIAEAQILRTANQAAEGMAVLEAAVRKYPDNTDLLYDYALMAEKVDQLDLMESALRKVIRLAPDNQHAYNALGYSFAERNIRLEEAYTLIERALRMAPDDPFIMDSMGWVQFRLGRLKEAEQLLRKAYSIRPDPEIATHLGEVLWVIGQREDARKFWRDARTRDPRNDTLRNTLSRLQVDL